MPSDPTPTPPRRKRWPVVLVLLLVIAGGAFWALSRPKAPSPAPETTAVARMQLLPAELLTVTRAPLRDTVRITGSLAPVRELSLPAEVAGRIDTVNIRAGETVAEGTELITIDVQTLTNLRDQQAATAEATRAQLELARAQLKRTADLVGRGVSTSSNLETEGANVAQLEASYAALRKQVAVAQDDLAKARIAAPFAGIVATRAIDIGAYVTIGTELLKLVDITALDLEAGVPVVYAPRLHPGQPVEIRVDGVVDHAFHGTIDRIAPITAEGTRMLPVYARIANTDGLLRGGMFAAGELVLEETPDAIAIPATALRTDDQGPHVIRIENDQAVRAPVTVARDWNRGRTLQITEGLAEGDVIVAIPMERLRPGMAVNRLGE